MARRRTGRHELDLDSMLDVLTNAVGILILITLLVLLLERGVVVETWIPMEREARLEDQVTMMVDGTAAYILNYPDELEIAYSNAADALERYEFEFEHRGRTATIKIITNPMAGEFVRSMTPHDGALEFGSSQAETSRGFAETRLARELETHAPPEHYGLSVLVRDSGAEHYRLLREQLFEQGYREIAWSPVGDEEPLFFGSSGFTARPQ